MITQQQREWLYTLWMRARPAEEKKTNAFSDAGWIEQKRALFDMNTGLEEALGFLFYDQPTFEDFLAWLEKKRDARPVPTGSDLPVADTLSDDDLEAWKENGFVIIRDAVSREQYGQAAAAIWEFLGADPGDPQSWYRPHPAKSGLMLRFHDHPALSAIRQSPRIRRAYEQLYAHRNIYHTIDKVSFNPPETASYKFAGSALHWDVSLILPIPHVFQGMLYLNDVSEDGGAFHCVPGFHRRADEWIRSFPSDFDLRLHAVETLKPIAVPASAGDFIIWHQALPHCATPNRSKRPRLAQYLTYLPEEQEARGGWR